MVIAFELLFSTEFVFVTWILIDLLSYLLILLIRNERQL